jgi:uncharacterized membrane protein YhhN
MRFFRFRLKTLMILIFVFALALGALVAVAKMDMLEWKEAKQGAVVFVPFLIMVALKLALAVGARARRGDPDAPAKPVVPDDPLS